MLGRRVTVESLTVLDSDGRAQGPAYTSTNDTLTFSITTNAFAHRLNFHRPFSLRDQRSGP